MLSTKPLPAQVTADRSQTNFEAARQCHAETRSRERADEAQLKVPQNQYMNDRIEQDYRRITRRTRPILGFKATATATAAVILGGIELIHMLRKGQMRLPEGQNPSLADQFNCLAA